MNDKPTVLTAADLIKEQYRYIDALYNIKESDIREKVLDSLAKNVDERWGHVVITCEKRGNNGDNSNNNKEV